MSQAAKLFTKTLLNQIEEMKETILSEDSFRKGTKTKEKLTVRKLVQEKWGFATISIWFLLTLRKCMI